MPETEDQLTDEQKQTALDAKEAATKTAQEAEAKTKAEAEAKQALDGLPTDPEELKKLVLKERKDRQDANSEAANFRKENKTLKDTVDKAERDKLSKEEQLAKDNTDLSQKAEGYRTKAFHNLVKAEAATLRFTDPGDAVKFLDAKLIDEDDDAKITEALKKLATDKPYLLKSDEGNNRKGVPGTKGNNPGGGTDQKADEEKTKSLNSKFPILGNMARARGQ